jgi:hypothetical protein
MAHVIKRFRVAGDRFMFYSYSAYLVFFTSVVATLYLSHGHFVVDFYGSSNGCFINYDGNGKLPGNKGGGCKPCKKFENGVIINNNFKTNNQARFI